jgi:hypothetical protein
MTEDCPGGTEGSNPSSSSGESGRTPLNTEDVFGCPAGRKCCRLVRTAGKCIPPSTDCDWSRCRRVRAGEGRSSLSNPFTDITTCGKATGSIELRLMRNCKSNTSQPCLSGVEGIPPTFDYASDRQQGLNIRRTNHPDSNDPKPELTVDRSGASEFSGASLDQLIGDHRE